MGAEMLYAEVRDLQRNVIELGDALEAEKRAHKATRADRDRWAARVKELEAQLQRVREVVR